MQADPRFETREALDAWLNVAYGFAATAELVGGTSTARHVLNQAERVEQAHAHLLNSAPTKDIHHG